MTMVGFKEAQVYMRGGDAQAPALIDWRTFYTDVIVPTYRYQPNISMKITGGPKPLAWDGKTEVEIYTEDDVADAGVDIYAKHNDDELSGSPVRFPLHEIYKTVKLRSNQENKTFVRKDRLSSWVQKATKKIMDRSDRLYFQGDTTLGIVGFVGADSTDLGAPTGVWDVDTGANGVLDNALDDLNALINNFESKGFYERPLKIGVTSYAYRLLRGTKVLYDRINNLQLWYETLPPGSQIYVSNNIQASVTANANTMVGFVEKRVNETTGLSEEGAYDVYSTGIVQGIHKTDIWEKRYGLKEKVGVKVADSDYVCYMDEIDTTT